jgi:SAM-dependent methyltransferase
VFERDRTRAYPGATGPCANTSVFYEEIARSLPEGSRVLDAGCGAGVGTAILSVAGHLVTGVDRDAAAADLAREIAKRATVDAANVEDLPAGRRFDAAVLVDVLGHVERPADALARLAAALPDGGALFVAEPRAYPLQSLAAPARRAFSKAQLASALATAGFRVERWIVEDGTFLFAVARRTATAAHDAYHACTVAASIEDAHARASEAVLLASAAASPAPEPGPEPLRLEALLARAEIALALGHGDPACADLLTAATLAAHDARAEIALGQIALGMDDPGAARDLASRALGRDPCVAGAHVLSALASPEPSACVGTWLAASSLEPDSFDIACAAADAAMAADDPRTAAFVLERARAVGPLPPPHFHETLARALSAVGRHVEAEYELRLVARV